MKFSGLQNKRMLVLFTVALAAALVTIGAALYRTFPRYAVVPAPDHGDSASQPSGQTGDSAKAQELHQLAMHLKAKPGHVPILFRLAQLSLEMGKPAEAAAHLQEILRQEPDNQDARLELGRALYEAGDAAGAIRETETLLANDPQNADALYNLGAIYANQNDAARARQYWSRAIASDPQSESGQKARQGLETLRMIPVSSSAGADLSATRGRRAGVAK